jgi:hypothetical protein
VRRPDPILAERRRLGPIEVSTLAAASHVEAHRALGRLVASPAAAAIEKRLAATHRDARPGQLAFARACRAFMEGRAAKGAVPSLVRRAIHEYFACLDVWAGAVGVSPDLALWAQDDNTGCQTGVLRCRDGSILLWHTEEDTIGYFDRPRLITLAVPGEARSAFLYPYLLPGPAFGWQREQIHAVDSLHMKRIPGAAGAFTAVASWLVWRLGPAIPAREVLRALCPYVDGCAIVVAQPSPGGATAMVHEIGGRHVQSRRLGARARSLVFQVNIVDRLDSPLGREQATRARDRALYEGRIRRAREAIERIRDPGPGELIRIMSNRRGKSYAYANIDVKAHCIARVSAAGIDLHTGAGAAHAADAVELRRVS